MASETKPQNRRTEQTMGSPLIRRAHRAGALLAVFAATGTLGADPIDVLSAEWPSIAGPADAAASAPHQLHLGGAGSGSLLDPGARGGTLLTWGDGSSEPGLIRRGEGVLVYASRPPAEPDSAIGISALVDPVPTPARPLSWGRIKALFASSVAPARC